LLNADDYLPPTVIVEEEEEFDWELENGDRKNSSKKERRLARYDTND